MHLGFIELFVLSIPLTALVAFCFIYAVIRLLRRPAAERKLQADEEQILMDTWDALGRFDERLTNLETILMKSEKEHPGSGKMNFS